MKEKIFLTLTDLDDYDTTIKQLLIVIDKILHYYAEKNVDNMVSFIEGFFVYFYTMYQYIQECKGEDNEE